MKRFFQGPWTARHIMVFLALFFGTVIAANGVMTYVAVTTFRGIEDQDAFRKGRDYNQVIAAREAQAALGWSADLDYEVLTRPAADGAMAVRLHLVDAQGQAIAGLAPRATLWRPSQSDLDRSVAMVEGQAGAYRAVLPLLRAGRWQVRVEADGPDGQALRWRRDVMVDPQGEMNGDG